jgi:PAS domain S-box-containing protein
MFQSKNNHNFGPPAEEFSWQKTGVRYAFAAVVVILGSLLRFWLLRLGPMPLFLTFYPAVLLVAIVTGGGPGVAATILSGLVSLHFFMPEQWGFNSPADMVALSIFAITSLSLCALAERLRRSRWAEAFALARQRESEELAQKNEELAQQAEELSQQSEELTQQNEELQSQSEEIQALNAELTAREDMLRKLLEAARLQRTEESVLTDICAAAKDIVGPPASAVVICERRGEDLFVRAQAGSRETPKPWRVEGAFPGLVMLEGRTAGLNDASLRPDVRLLQIPGEAPFHSALSTPLRVGGEIFGAVTIYSAQKHEWTTEQFQLVEWLATHCGQILDTLRLQDQLRRTAEQNRLLSDLLERSDQPFGIGYPDGRLGFINPAFERLTGYSRKELEAMDWANVLTPIQWRSGERARLEELQGTGQPVRYEKEYIRKDGSLVPIELLVHLIKDDQGQPLFYSFITDISERKRAESAIRRNEARWNSALENLAEGAIIATEAGQVIYWNPAARTMHGFTSERDGIGPLIETPNTFQLWTPNGSRQLSFEEWPMPRLMRGETVRQLELRLRRPDQGWERICLYSGAMVETAGGERLVYLSVFDLTEQRKAEAALAKANDELEQRVSERTAELAQRAAQLRALAGELTLSEQRERSRLAKILHDHLQQVLVAAKFRLAIMGKGAEEMMKTAISEVQDLIDESIASSRSLTAELSPPILHEAGLAAGLKWLAARMADTQGLLVDLQMEEPGPLPEDLKIMLFESARELLFNIVKHARTRSSAINLRQADGFLQLTVSDQGVGFDPAAMPRAGESGAGFGLFSIRERLELFGGWLEIESAPGQGSRIFVSVPMPEQETAPPSPDLAGVPLGMRFAAQSSQPHRGKKIRVLLADDHAVVRQGMATLLGYETDFEVVGGAADGQEAIEFARNLLPDVILMDMSMPGLNGIEATRIISRELPDIRIIGLSMYEDSERAEAMRDAGAIRYLTKSGPAGELINAIRSAIRRS